MDKSYKFFSNFTEKEEKEEFIASTNEIKSKIRFANHMNKAGFPAYKFDDILDFGFDTHTDSASIKTLLEKAKEEKEKIYSLDFGDVFFLNGVINGWVLIDAPSTFLFTKDRYPELIVCCDKDTKKERIHNFDNDMQNGMLRVDLRSVLFSDRVNVRKATLKEVDSASKPLLFAVACSHNGWSHRCFDYLCVGKSLEQVRKEETFHKKGLKEGTIIENKKNLWGQEEKIIVPKLGQSVLSFYSSFYKTDMKTLLKFSFYKGVVPLPRDVSIFEEGNKACIFIYNFPEHRNFSGVELIRLQNKTIISTTEYIQRNIGKYPYLRSGYYIMGKQLANKLFLNIYRFILAIKNGFKPIKEDTEAIIILNQYAKYSEKIMEEPFQSRLKNIGVSLGQRQSI